MQIAPRLFAFVIIASMAAPAYSHTVWENGEPVPDWVSKACCGKEDVHHLTEDQVHITPDGYRIDGYPDLIPLNRALPSPDGTPWVFYRQIGSYFSPVYCFFVPLKGT